MDTENNGEQIPEIEVSDSLELVQRKDLVRRSPAAQSLMNFLANVDSMGEDAEESYKKALSDMKEKVAEVVLEIARMEGCCPENDYPARWTLVFAATELKHPAILPLLKNIVLTPIPSERSKTSHSFSTVAEETIIRTTAIEGIASLARDGNQEAIESLFDFLKICSFSIKRATVQGLLSTEQGESLRDQIKECLTKEEQFLLDIKSIDVRNVPQITKPEQDLSEEGREAKKKSAPKLSEFKEEKDSFRGYSPKMGKQEKEGE